MPRRFLTWKRAPRRGPTSPRCCSRLDARTRGGRSARRGDRRAPARHRTASRCGTSFAGSCCSATIGISKALDAFEAAAALNAGLPQLSVNVGVSRLALGDRDGARRGVRRRAHPLRSRCRGSCLPGVDGRAGRSPPDARRHAEQAVAIEGDLAESRGLLGRILLKQGNPQARRPAPRGRSSCGTTQLSVAVPARSGLSTGRTNRGRGAGVRRSAPPQGAGGRARTKEGAKVAVARLALAELRMHLRVGSELLQVLLMCTPVLLQFDEDAGAFSCRTGRRC